MYFENIALILSLHHLVVTFQTSHGDFIASFYIVKVFKSALPLILLLIPSYKHYINFNLLQNLFRNALFVHFKIELIKKLNLLFSEQPVFKKKRFIYAFNNLLIWYSQWKIKTERKILFIGCLLNDDNKQGQTKPKQGARNSIWATHKSVLPFKHLRHIVPTGVLPASTIRSSMFSSWIGV